MTFANHLQKVFNVKEKALADSIVSTAFNTVLTKIIDNMLVMRRENTCMYLDDIFDTNKSDFDIFEYLEYFKEVQVKLEESGFEVDLSRDDNDFSVTIQVK